VPSFGPDLSPRTVIRWHFGERVEVPDVVPTPFGPGRARELRGPDFLHAYYSRTEPCMTDGELAYLNAVWDTMPGCTCRYDAFRRILDGKVPTP
jgi:hypothetical protein